MHKSWRWRAVAIGSVALLGLGACSGDDDDDASASESDTEADAPAEDPKADAVAFCDAIADMGIGVSIGDGYEQVDDALLAAEEVAPDEISAAVTTMADESRAQVADGPPPEGTPPSLPPDEYFAAAAEVGEYMADSCDYQVIDVTATEHAFAGVPAEAARGKTLVRLTNDGAEYHHLVLQRVHYGETRSVEEILALPEGGDLLDYQGSAFAPPGHGSWFVVELGIGRQALMCIIPTGSTTAEELRSGQADHSPTHDTKGETADIQVS